MLEQVTGWLPFSQRRRMTDLHQVLAVYTFVFLVWGIYRQLFRLPEAFEETVLKFLVFGVPVFFVVLVKEKGKLEDLGMVTKGMVASLYFGLLFGLWLAVAGNVVAFLRDGGIGFNPDIGVAEFGNLMLLGLVTAFWEQLFFMGYMLPRVMANLRHELISVLVVAILFAVIHLPIQIAQDVELSQLFIRFVLLFTLGFGNGVLYLRFRNLIAPIFSHLAWGSVIYLFG